MRAIAMRLFGFIFSRRHGMATLAGAFVDGELGGKQLREFEAHLPGCPECRRTVQIQRAMKAQLANLPAVTAPRSFRLTEEMVAGRQAGKLRAAPTPLYVGFARAGAALAVGAFAVVLVAGSLNSSGGDEQAAAGRGDNALSDNDAGSGDLEMTSQNNPVAPGTVATPVPSPGIAPSTGGGATGAGLATPPASATAGDVPVQPPSTGSERNEREGAGGADDAAGKSVAEGLGPVPGETGKRTDGNDGSSMPGAAVWLGVLAAGSLLVLGAVEFRRRRG